MKALIRDNDVVMECDGVDGIDWITGQPMTNPEYYGGPYRLVQNYVQPQGDAPAIYEEVVVEDPEPETEDCEVEEADFIEIDGKRYSKEELRRLIE